MLQLWQVGHKKEHCREWLKLTKEQQEQADKEKSDQRSDEKHLQHLKCCNCNKFGHIAWNYSEKKAKDSNEGSSGGFAMMCLEEEGQSQVEELPTLVS